MGGDEGEVGGVESKVGGVDPDAAAAGGDEQQLGGVGEGGYGTMEQTACGGNGATRSEAL